MTDRQTLNKELETVNRQISELNNNLIKGLQVAGIEFIDLYTYIDRYNKLAIRKDKILYLLAVDV